MSPLQITEMSPLQILDCKELGDTRLSATVEELSHRWYNLCSDDDKWHTSRTKRMLKKLEARVAHLQRVQK